MSQRYTRGVILNVPYTEKDEAKQLGAWWDPDLKRWFVPNGRDTAPFNRWLQEESAESQKSAER